LYNCKWGVGKIDQERASVKDVHSPFAIQEILTSVPFAIPTEITKQMKKKLKNCSSAGSNEGIGTIL
jgi:hypothetical protein